MQRTLMALQERVGPAEEIFFAWLARIFGAAVLVGCAWIDDAPPLELGAMIVALYVIARVISQFGALAAAAPFRNRLLRMLFALISVVLLGLAFISVAMFVDGIADLVVAN